MSYAAWLLALAWPLAKKILVSLGIGWVTYKGMELLAGQVANQIIAAWGQLGSSTLQVLSLGGVPQALGIILGGLTAGAALMAAARMGKVL